LPAVGKKEKSRITDWQGRRGRGEEKKQQTAGTEKKIGDRTETRQDKTRQ